MAENEPEPIEIDLTPTEDGLKPLDRKSISDDKERARFVEEVLRDQARREVLRDVAYRRPRASFQMRVAAGVLGLIALAAWVLPVPGLRPNIPFPMDQADEEVALRVAAFIQAKQVEAFWMESGRLPDQLRETGEPMPGIMYERLDARTYTLRGITERATIHWISTDADSTLLGKAGTERLKVLFP